MRIRVKNPWSGMAEPSIGIEALREYSLITPIRLIGVSSGILSETGRTGIPITNRLDSLKKWGADAS